MSPASEERRALFGWTPRAESIAESDVFRLLQEFARGDLIEDHCIGYPRCQVMPEHPCKFCRARELVDRYAP